ncbi:MAG: hypothetical protein V3V99_13735 [candidate division Zixibacteria bacterium]
MQCYGKTLLSVLVFMILFGAGSVFSTIPTPPRPYDVSLELTDKTQKSSPITLNLKYGPTPEFQRCGDTGSVTVIALTYRIKDTLSVNTWPVQFDEGHTYSTSFQVSVLDNDTTTLRILLGCGALQFYIYRDVITTGDEVQLLENFNPHPGGKNVVSKDPIRDTLTQEHLQVMYDVILFVKEPSHRERAESILGPLPDSCIYDRYMGYYRLKISLENLIKLADAPVGFEYFTPPPWSSKYKPPKDSLNEDQNESDTIEDEQSSLPQGLSPTYPPGISLEYVDAKSALEFSMAMLL